ncbi:uncharacterized protein LOC124321063 [Daphnia pulicaria]|uniref:uncharacterized protein LOC124321063 n=1 Tax=Daphnia pulicaria TaxID=35523 RepID=UPI001EECBCC4|nr:uncharacterized protein LOC124321063 [Daphnia pulicaria]
MMLVDVAASEQNEDVLLQNESRPPSESTILNTASFRGYFEAIVGALSAAMLLLITAIVIIIVMSHRKKTVQENLVAFNVPFDIDTLNGTESVMGFNSTTEKTNTISKFQYVLPVNEKKDLILEYAVSSPTKSWTATQPIRVQQQYNTLHNIVPTTRRDKASSFNSYVNPCVATIPNKILDGKSGRMATRSSDVSSIAWNIKPQSHRFAVDNLSLAIARDLELKIQQEELEEQWELFRELEKHQERGKKRMQEQEREMEEQDRELEHYERKVIQNLEENSRIGG